MNISLRPAVLLVLLAVLAGCSEPTEDEKFAPACPRLALLADAGDVVRYKGDGRDVTDLVLDGRIVAVPAQCKHGDHGFVTTTMKVQATVTRGPAATSRDAALTYFVTVTEGDRIVDQQDYPMSASFPPNVDRVGLEGQEIVLNFPVTAKKAANAYQVYVGFRLTPEELAYNRQHKTQ
jgi:hypothetical protein